MLNLSQLSRRSLFLILASVIVLSAVLALGVTALIAQGVTPDPTSEPIGTAFPPAETPETPPPTMTLEEETRWREELRRKDREEGRLVPAVGPETRGRTLVIAGRTLKLPEDAYIKHKADAVYCVAGESCPPAPLYMIARGESTISIDGEGNLFDEQVTLGEEDTFDFIKQVFGKRASNARTYPITRSDRSCGGCLSF